MDVSRYVDTAELKFEVEFITPCFLGGADSNAEIRTAPFKNLIRRWWRIENGHLSPEELWEKESELFGSTQKNPNNKGKVFGKSKVELKILDKEKCKISNDKNLLFSKEKLIHPEVSRPIEVESYLGMGPIFWNTEIRKQEYKFRYIEPSSILSISLIIPKEEKQCFIKVLSLINLWGTIGSRSRNGWGSIKIKGTDFSLLNNIDSSCLIDFSTQFSTQNQKKYPYGIVKDHKGILCWKTKEYPSWGECMKDLAKKYLTLRVAFKFKKTDEKKLESRHLLGYPITHHGVEIWDTEKNDKTGKIKKINTRLPSQLIFKVIKKNDGNYYGQVLHLSYCIPLKGFSIQEQKDIWTFVHDVLDHNGWQRNVSGGNSK